MRFLTMFVETTGDDPDDHQILAVAAVVGDFSDTNTDDLPQIRGIMSSGGVYGDPMKLSTIGDLLEEVSLCRAPWDGERLLNELRQMQQEYFNGEPMPLRTGSVRAWEFLEDVLGAEMTSLFNLEEWVDMCEEVQIAVDFAEVAEYLDLSILAAMMVIMWREYASPVEA